MSFGFGGSSGFGANQNQNQNQQGTGFGGFGSSTTGGGFGAAANTNTTTTFGSNTGGSLFGGNTNTNTGGFGFGSNNNNAASTTPAFGSAAKPAFGAPATGGLFGSNNNTTGTTSTFGGFGNTANTSTGGFGSSTGGGLFGAQNKPAFGAPAATSTGGGLFGASNTNTSTFGQSTGGFGQTATTGGFGQSAQTNVNQGTAATPFTAHQEKDTAANTTSHYQSLTFMQPYLNYSFEELRVADYNAGRRFGNSNGQAGSFGQSTGFGGFGGQSTTPSTGFGGTSTTGGLFGSTNNNTATQSPFGQNNTQTTTTSAFGSGGGGLFGQNKPASGGLFGNTTPAANTGGSTFGGFGNTNNNTSTTTATNTGGGLFGNTQTQNKPFGGFGSTQPAATTTTGGLFGSSTNTGFGQQQPAQNTGGGLFGSSTPNTTTPAFGAAQPQQTSAFGGFGSTAQQNTGSSLFGGNNNNQNQQKPGGVFGSGLGGTSTGTTGGLFGSNNNTQQQSTSLFGSNNNTQQSGGLFGAKPANSLFGGTANTSTNNGSSMFGNNNQTQNQGGGLFGQNNNNGQQKSLFGSTNNGTTGGSLFGGGLGATQNNQNNSGSLFGGSQQAPGNSLFGGSQQNGQQQQPQTLTASLMQNPYGNDQLFAGLGTPSPAVGPLATPLTGAQKPASRPSIVPAFKINPTASMRLITPQKRPQGYGFTYSAYGTPGSAQSFTPGRSSSIFGSGGLGRPLSKSLSTSNLRSPLAAEDSVLAPGAFTPNYRPYSSGNSIRRLKIDRTLRTDLFGDHTSDRSSKRVSFDGSAAAKNGVAESQANGAASPDTSNALVRTESDGPEPSSEELGLLRSSRPAQKDTRSNGSLSRPEMEQVRGNELAIVPEDEQVPASAPTPVPSKALPKSQVDQEPGAYYMIPSMQELRDMSREQLKSVAPFTVGRVGIGKVEFSKVDLNTIRLDEVMGEIVKLNVRSATVYETGVNTPPEGKGLNVPSTITLENSWPRSNGGRLPVHERKGPRFEKHVERLKRVGGTEFVSYSAESGEWVFRVQHFTTYGLDDEEEDTMMEGGDGQVAPNTPTQSTLHLPSISEDVVMSPAASDPDDTFDFKKGSKTIPGGFGSQALFEDDDHVVAVQHEDEVSEDGQEQAMLDDPFRVSNGNQSLISPPDSDDEANQVVGAFPPAEQAPPKSILKGISFGTPVKESFDLNEDWAEQLQRTVSPRKQDRRALREQQSTYLENGSVPNASVFGRPTTGKGFDTTMDIMNSLWNQSTTTRGRGAAAGSKGFQSDPEPQTNGDVDHAKTPTIERDIHSSVKPCWTAEGTLIYTLVAKGKDGQQTISTKAGLVVEGKDVRVTNVQAPKDTYNAALNLQLDTEATQIQIGKNDIPAASTNGSILNFVQLAASTNDDVVTSAKEREIWKLASILFDPIEVAGADHIDKVPSEDLPKFEKQIRRNAVLGFWKTLTRTQAKAAARDVTAPEEKALAHLTCGDIEGACTVLADAGNVHLATLIAQLPAGPKSRETMKKQIDAWRDQNSLSEFTPSIRALYEIVAGNCASSKGKSGAAEDRAPTFCVSEEFGLDWKQSLGLRLWFADEDLAAAVERYVKELAAGEEKVRPVAVASVANRGSKADEKQDGLLLLLRLYASQSGAPSVLPNADELFSAVSWTSHALDARLGWQLATQLRAKSILDNKQLPDASLDTLTSSLALQLEAENTTSSILSACTVLLHLSSPTNRKSRIEALLARRAPLLTPPTHPFATDAASDAPLQAITTDSIPAAWLQSARAATAAAAGDRAAQAAYLVLAGDLGAAHGVLCKYVGPRAVIEQSYDALREILGHIAPAAGKAAVEGWEKGGRVYFDFVHLLDLTAKGTAGRKGDEERKVLGRLGEGLKRIEVPAAEGADRSALEVRVAVAEMAGVVSRLAGEVEGLPLPDEGFVVQGAKLWALYGRALRV